MVWHLLWKDIRRFKWWLVAWFGMMGVIWGLTTAAGASLFLRFLFAGIPLVLFAIFKYIFIIRVVQEDPLTGQTAFWLTRPIPGWALLLAKACFLVLFVGLPSAVRSVATTPNMPADFQIADVAISFSYVITIIILIWLAALWTSRLFMGLLAALVLTWIYFGIMPAIYTIPYIPALKAANTNELNVLIGLILSKTAVQYAATVILGGGIIVYHYLNRRTTHIKLISGIAFIFIIVLGCLWNTNCMPASFVSAVDLKKEEKVLIKSRTEKVLRELVQLVSLFNSEKADPKTMAKEQAEITARLSKFKWETMVDVNFDDGKHESFIVKAADPGLTWSVSNQCGRISGKSTLGKWAGCKIERQIACDTRALIEVSGDFKIAKSSGYQLIALGCGTKAGALALFFEGEHGTGQTCTMSRGYIMQRRFIKIPVEMEKELNGFEFGNETQAFHKMRMVLDRPEARIYYFADDQLLGILKYTGDIGTITSIWMDLEARDKNIELDVLYDNLRVRVAGDTWDEKR